MRFELIERQVAELPAAGRDLTFEVIETPLKLIVRT